MEKNEEIGHSFTLSDQYMVQVEEMDGKLITTNNNINLFK